MQKITAIDAKNRFGQLLESALREPVTVTKQSRPAAVVLSVEDYELHFDGIPRTVEGFV